MTSKSPSPASIVEAMTLPDLVKGRRSQIEAKEDARRHMEMRERALQLATLRAPEGASLPELFERASEIYRFIVSGDVPPNS